MKKLLTAAAVAVGLAFAPAQAATTFVFKGDGLNVTPLGTAGADFQENCASTGDFCSIDHTAGLDYERDGINLTVKAYANDVATRLIQDVNPSDSGLGAFSENNGSDDQTQFDSGEAIEFIFNSEVRITDVEFNAGGDRNCTAAAGGGGEGVCGEFRLDIFDISDMLVQTLVVDVTNTDILPVLGEGARFVLTALTQGGGFTVAQMTVSDVPIPGAIPLLLSGLAGLGFASKKKKKEAA